jgi:glycosyltransferase involved in cell wall biosynthesis
MMATEHPPGKVTPIKPDGPHASSASPNDGAAPPLRVLFSAYACGPGRGSEPGAGWNWPIAMARRGHRVTVLTTPRFRTEIEEALQGLPTPKPAYVFVEEPDMSGVRGWLPSRAQILIKYLLWQKKLPRAAQQLDGIDIIHHVTWGSLRGGSRLFDLPAPLVFGPVGGGQTAPNGLVEFLGDHARGERVRSALVAARFMRWFGTSRHVARHASAVLVTNRATFHQAQGLGARRVEFMLDSGIDHTFLANVPRNWAAPTLSLLWIGRLLPIKGLAIALEALAQVPSVLPVTLRVVGDGPEMPRMRAIAERLGLGRRVECCGQVPWEDIPRHIDGAHLFAFTSVRESFGSQLLEAAARGLPILTLDHHGAADHLPDSAAIKVPVSTARDTVEAYAHAIALIAGDRSRLPGMSSAAHHWAAQHTWAKKAEACERIYRSLHD